VNGKLVGRAFGVALPDASIVDLMARLEKCAKHEDIASVVQEYAASETKGAPDWIVEEMVFTDLQIRKASLIPDIGAGISLNEHFVKSVDDEWGYSNCLVDLVIHMNGVDGI